VPIAEVARNVDSAVRYGVHRALDRDIDELAIHVDRLLTPVPHTGPDAVADVDAAPADSPGAGQPPDDGDPGSR
jgi:hypothetical protein